MTEVAEICSQLIRIDSTNPGPGERAAAEYVAGLLDEVGIEPTLVEPVGDGLYVLETEIRPPTVPLTFAHPEDGAAVDVHDVHPIMM